MKIKSSNSTEAILSEIGERLTKQRIASGYTQASLARHADVSKRTIERLESGASIQMSTMIQILRAFDLLTAFDSGIPSKPRTHTPEEKHKRGLAPINHKPDKSTKNNELKQASRNRWSWESKS